MVVEKLLANTPVKQFRLFDLDADPAEKNDVMGKHPKVAERMIKQLAEIIEAGRSRN